MKALCHFIVLIKNSFNLIYGKSTLFAQNDVYFVCENIASKCEKYYPYKNIIHTFSFCGSRKENICVYTNLNFCIFKDKL